VRELRELKEFVNNNKECIEEFFDIKRDSSEKASQGLKKNFYEYASEEEEDPNSH
jgi:hypothetical protein